MNNLYDYFKNVFEENKLVQSFIIGNTRFDDIKEDLFKIFNTFFFKNNSNLEENPDLFVLKSENGIVSKDNIKELISNINTTSQFNNTKIYIIDECEKLNDFAYNAVLKTLEEPALNVYAFLITKNIDSVKPTILSRCQKIFVSSEVKEKDIDDDIKVIGDEIIELMKINPIKIISNHFEIYNKISDRDTFKNILVYIEKKFINDLNNKINNNSILDTEIELLSKKILIINNNINISDKYLNKNLSIDRFLIEMWRCNNENS